VGAEFEIEGEHGLGKDQRQCVEEARPSPRVQSEVLDYLGNKSGAVEHK